MGMTSIKIIRDGLRSRIPERALRVEGDRRIVLDLLVEKSVEEIGEFARSGWADPKELADALEVLRGMAHHAGIAWTDVESARTAKYGAAGGFEGGLVYDPSLDDSPEAKGMDR